MTMLHDAARVVDPLGDADILDDQAVKRNRAKVGSGRPSSLLYTYGPGAIMDLPQFTIMPTGLDDWDRIWNRRDGDPPTIHAPRLRDAVRKHMRSRDVQLRRSPGSRSSEPTPPRQRPRRARPRVPAVATLHRLRHARPGVPVRVRQHPPYRTDLARFEHAKCPGRGAPERRPGRAVPARYLLACTGGHLDEFP